MVNETLEQQTKPNFRLSGLSGVITSNEVQVHQSAKTYVGLITDDKYGCLLCPGDCINVCGEFDFHCYEV